MFGNEQFTRYLLWLLRGQLVGFVAFYRRYNNIVDKKNTKIFPVAKLTTKIPLVRIIAWDRACDKPLSEPMVDTYSSPGLHDLKKNGRYTFFMSDFKWITCGGNYCKTPHSEKTYMIQIILVVVKRPLKGKHAHSGQNNYHNQDKRYLKTYDHHKIT